MRNSLDSTKPFWWPRGKVETAALIVGGGVILWEFLPHLPSVLLLLAKGVSTIYN